MRLESETLVTRRLGTGALVNFRPRTNPEDVAGLTGPLERIDVRLRIEPNIVRLAVVSARDIERIAAAIARMDESSADTESFTNWDKDFHQLVCEATQNPLMV